MTNKTIEKRVKAWAVISGKGVLKCWEQNALEQCDVFRTRYLAKIAHEEWKSSGFSTKVVPIIMSYNITISGKE